MKCPAESLVLSLFPGIDILGRAFAHFGYSIVLGPDLLFDTRIETFHIPPGTVTGIIGGPPCTNYSDANRKRNPDEGDRLLREYLRVVDEGHPDWFLIENVRNVPDVTMPGYSVQRLDVLDTDFGGKQSRLRHIQFGSLDGNIIRPLRTLSPRRVTAVPTLTTAPAGPGDRYSRRCAKQGIATLRLSSFTPAARRRVIGNAVPWSIAHSLARAVTLQSPPVITDCACGCGRTLEKKARFANAACRKRAERRRSGHGRTVTLDRFTTHAHTGADNVEPIHCQGCGRELNQAMPARLTTRTDARGQSYFLRVCEDCWDCDSPNVPNSEPTKGSSTRNKAPKTQGNA